MDFILRTAAAADVDALLTLWRDAAENEGRPADTSQAVTALLSRDPDAVIVAVRGGELIGSVIAGWDGWRGHLYRLAVHPGWRRRGVGGALVAAAEERLRSFGARRADAMVFAPNKLGQQLWRAHGYQPTARLAPLGQAHLSPGSPPDRDRPRAPAAPRGPG